jgi:hypothetical protein
MTAHYKVLKTLLIITLLSVSRPPAMDPNTIPFPTDPNRINYDIVGWRQGFVEQPLTFRFKVGFPGTDPNDPSTVMTVIASSGALVPDPNSSRIIVGTDVVDTYTLSRIRGIPTVEYIDVTVTAANGQSDSRTVLFSFVPPPSPVIFVQATAIPYWLPHGVAYLNAMDPNDQGRVWQESVKALATHGGRAAPTDRWKNDVLYLAWIQGKVEKP